MSNLTPTPVIHGEVIGGGTITGVVLPGGTIGATIQPGGSAIERYPGPYEITPTVDGQTLPTAQRRMTEDLNINPIPCTAVSNPAGGYTVIIGDVRED